MKNLILTVGLPRSGKSTWAKEQGHPIVNSDSIRLAIHGQPYIQPAEKLVWAVAHYMVQSLFIAGHETVIVDATNGSRKRRDAWRSEDWSLRYKVFDTTPSTCFGRARSDNRQDLIPVIERMLTTWEGLDDDEQENSIS